MATTLNHLHIGEIRGKAADGVEQFLGIQYATLKDRFAPAVLKEYNGNDDVVDATRIGPQSAPTPDGAIHEQHLIGHPLPDKSLAWPLEHSDTECLNLNITRPASIDRPLPVFLFIHGGGFANGSAGFPQYDMARFVRLSVSKGLPIIVVTINYRLGVPGWLTSSEMREEGGYEPNNGLRDQRVAIRWVKKFIAGFGGDPEEVTLAGESAGCVSCCFHLQSEEELCKRVISMSGTSLLLPPLPPPAAEATYAAVIQAFGLQDLAPKEKLERLKTLPAAELREKTTGLPLFPVADPSLPLTPEKYADVHSARVVNGCETLLIGDCAFDGSIQGLRLGSRKKNIGQAFHSYITGSSSLPFQTAKKLLDSYGLSPDLAPDEEAFRKVLEVLNDVCFYAPTLSYASAFSEAGKEIYTYRFNALNPWPEAQWYGTTPHILDIAFLFQNYNGALSAQDQEVAEDFAETVFRFVRGEELWGKGDGKVARVFGGKEDGIVEDVPEKTGRRGVVLDLAKEVAGGMDALAGVIEGFLRAPPAS